MISYQKNLTPIIFLILSNLLTSIRSQTYSCSNQGNYSNTSPYQANLDTLLSTLSTNIDNNGFYKDFVGNFDRAICFDERIYTINSTYQANLNTLLSTLSTNINDNGFYNAFIGINSDGVNASALCRGDTQLDFCRSCVQNATSDLVQLCPNRRESIIWLEYCTLWYSETYLRSTYTESDYIWNPQNITNLGSFTYDLATLLENIRGQASNGGSLRKVAASNRSTSGNRIIYGMVQCFPDLSSEECYYCLGGFLQAFQTFNGDEFPIGLRIVRATCNLRYEISPFYNQTRLQELAQLSESSPPLSQPSPPLSQPGNNNSNRTAGNNNSNRIIIIIVVSVVAGLVIISLSVYFIIKMKQKPKEEGIFAADEISIFESLQYDFRIFKAATNDFSEGNKLGQGGFGAVYKGTLPNGQEIAVKRLSIGSQQGDLEFKNEVMLLVKLQHRNLVRLLGYSREGSEKLLVYEFVQNASLDAFIFDTTMRSLLDWGRRYKIIEGIARGILYLHEDSRLTIIHRDLKAGNILLDGNMNPKIADFGMARLFVPDENQGSTNRIVGTYGYMAPEYVMHGQFSVKSDVFSFGVLLLEIISGLKNSSYRHGETKTYLISSAWENWRQGTAANLVDPILIVGSSVPADILRCIHIGLLCVQENAVDRPSMASIISMLNNFSITLPVPSHPAFFVYNRNDSGSLPLQEFSWGEENSNRPSKINGPESISQNEMSISEFQAR